MRQAHIEVIAGDLGLKNWQVENVITLLDEGATIPFMSRYRKERTGSLDEVVLTTIRDRVNQLRELDKRREFILKTIDEQGKLNPELEQKIREAETMALLEDLYLPYKPKRRTRATMAREKGLEPLAEILFEQGAGDPGTWAQDFVDEEKEVHDVEEALQGARDIIAEWISEDAGVREDLRRLFFREGVIVSRVIRGKEEEGQKYRDYFDFEEEVRKVPSHRMLAMRRGEKEMILSLDIQPPPDKAIGRVGKKILKGDHGSTRQVKLAVEDAYKRLLKPSMETEIRLQTKKTADEEAIRVFTDNLRQLLLAAPMGQKRVLAIDPGFRTGCKVVCLDSQGKLLEHTAVFPNEPQKQVVEAAKTIHHLVNAYQVEAIAIGNGTASRETEAFIRSIGLPAHIAVVMVNESGASIYSASDVARKEFPDQDVTVRGAVSIGRRLMDPLAELVKIDPKSIGVGQYQHDVDQNALKASLDDVVESCVNSVGVELNTASTELLSYVSGLGPVLATNIVNYRNEHGPFRSRKALKQVPRMGEKVFELCAGFLRIRDAANPLDASAVHPERYELVDRMASDAGSSVGDLIRKPELRSGINIRNYISDEVGLPTLEDIMRELGQPGRDPRESFEVFRFSDEVHEITDLKKGMQLPGIVTNITKFGAFVDIGVHQDGLVHISQLSDQYVSDPATVVKLQQQVMVTVMDVDVDRKRISLSMKSGEPASAKKTAGKGSAKKQDPGGDLQAKLSALKGKFR